MTFDPPDVDPFEDDEKPRPDEWEGDNSDKPTDSNGRRYNPYQGSQSPTDGRCNALLTAWRDRYDEPRFCTALPAKTFNEDGSEFCKNHKSREYLMKQAKNLFKHGAFATNYIRVFDTLREWEKIEAVQVFSSLLEDSVYDFDSEVVEWSFDVSEDEEGPDIEFREELKIPQRKTYAAKALWLAAIDLAKLTRINTILLKDDLEHTKVVDVDPETGEQITQRDEHYMHLAYSRLSTDYRKLLENGGISIKQDGDEININGENIEYVTSVESIVGEQQESTPEAEKFTETSDFPLNNLDEEDDEDEE